MTLPVGLKALWNVAVSPTVAAVPTVSEVVGLACVVMLGEALPTAICSFASAQPVVKLLLSASPA